MNIHVGDEIELTEEVVPENTAEKWGSGKPSCLCHTCHDLFDRAVCS